MDMAKKKTSEGDLLSVAKTDNNPLAYRDEFETIYGIISSHRNRAMNAVHNESLLMLWEVGAFVSDRLKRADWGDGVVRMLADYIRTRNPKAKGWSYSTIYRMVRFYDTYSSEEFTQTVNRYGMQNYLAGTERKELLPTNEKNVPFELAQRGKDKIVSIGLTQIDDGVTVPFEMAQISKVPFTTDNRGRSEKCRRSWVMYLRPSSPHSSKISPTPPDTLPLSVSHIIYNLQLFD